MRAETVYNVFKELSSEEKTRFKKMVGVEVPESHLKPRKAHLMGDAVATEYLIKHIFKKGKK